MRTRHYWLLVLFTLFTLCYVFGIWLNADWLAGFSSNLAAGFLGAFLIVFLIDRSLAKEREAETKRIQNIAFKQLRPILLRHLGLLIDWYRASVPEKPKSLPQSFQEIFGEDYFYQIGFLDFLKTSGTFPPLNWMQYSSHQLTSLNTETYRVLDKYAVYMDATFLELVENVLDSDLVSMLIQLCNVDIQSFDKAHGIVRKYTFLYGPDMTQSCHEHIQSVIQLIDFFNKKYPNPILVKDLGLWPDNTAPNYGSGRITPDL